MLFLVYRDIITESKWLFVRFFMGIMNNLEHYEQNEHYKQLWTNLVPLYLILSHLYNSSLAIFLWLRAKGCLHSTSYQQYLACEQVTKWHINNMQWHIKTGQGSPLSNSSGNIGDFGEHSKRWRLIFFIKVSLDYLNLKNQKNKKMENTAK